MLSPYWTWLLAHWPISIAFVIQTPIMLWVCGRELRASQQENEELRRISDSMAARIAAQGDALGKVAERSQPATMAPLQGPEKPEVQI